MTAILQTLRRHVATSPPFTALVMIAAISFVVTLFVALSIPRAPEELRLTTQGGLPAAAGLLGDPMAGEVPVGVVAVPAGQQAPAAPVDTARTPYGLTSTGGLTASGIPARAHQAYVAAAAELGRTDPSCALPWTVLAGIGRVESNHGRFGGSGITPAGLVQPPILGIRLDGSRAGTATIRDSDGGRFDGDSGFDRAVGPMQFLPGTWRAYGADADRDSVAHPQDIDDAALGAARYLCSGASVFSTRAGAWSAVYRYNHSDSYVSLVLSLSASYASGRPIAFTEAPPGAERPAGESATPPGPPPAVPAPPAAPAAPGAPAGPAGPGAPVPPPPTTPGVTPLPTPAQPTTPLPTMPPPTRPPATRPPATTPPTTPPTTVPPTTTPPTTTPPTTPPPPEPTTPEPTAPATTEAPPADPQSTPAADPPAAPDTTP